MVLFACRYVYARAHVCACLCEQRSLHREILVLCVEERLEFQKARVGAIPGRGNCMNKIHFDSSHRIVFVMETG